jgi:hypothetical protein
MCTSRVATGAARGVAGAAATQNGLIVVPVGEQPEGTYEEVEEGYEHVGR